MDAASEVSGRGAIQRGGAFSVNRVGFLGTGGFRLWLAPEELELPVDCGRMRLGGLGGGTGFFLASLLEEVEAPEPRLGMEGYP